jgi:hypothetical protein
VLPGAAVEVMDTRPLDGLSVMAVGGDEQRIGRPVAEKGGVTAELASVYSTVPLLSPIDRAIRFIEWQRPTMEAPEDVTDQIESGVLSPPPRTPTTISISRRGIL